MVFCDCPSLIVLKCHEAQQDLSEDSSILPEFSGMIFQIEKDYNLWAVRVTYSFPLQGKTWVYSTVHVLLYAYTQTALPSL